MRILSLNNYLQSSGKVLKIGKMLYQGVNTNIVYQLTTDYLLMKKQRKD